MRSVLLSMTARLKAEPYYLVLSVFLTTVFVVLGIVITTVDGAGLRVAYTGPEANKPESNAYVRFIEREKAPLTSSLVMGDYDAAIEYDGDEYTVTSLTDDNLENILTLMLAGEDIGEYFETEQNPALRIVGITMMILMMQAIFYLDFLIEDRKNRTLKRMVSSPLSVKVYLSMLVTYALLVVGVIAMTVLLVASTLFNQELGMSLGAYGFIYFIVLAFGVALALLLVSAIDVRDNAAALFVLIVITTTLLSGAFVPYEPDSVIVEWLMKATPQHHILEATKLTIDGTYFSSHAFIVIAMSAALYLISGVLIRQKLSTGKY